MNHIYTIQGTVIFSVALHQIILLDLSNPHSDFSHILLYIIRLFPFDSGMLLHYVQTTLQNWNYASKILDFLLAKSEKKAFSF